MARRSTRRGLSIVQLVGVMMLISVLMITSSRLLQIAYRAQRDALIQLGQIETLSQVTQRLRSDAAGATTFTAKKQLELVNDHRLVRYEQDGETLVRRWGPVNNAASAEGTRLPGEQQWQFPPGTTFSWDVDRDHELPLLRCFVTFADKQRDDITWTYLLGGDDDA